MSDLDPNSHPTPSLDKLSQKRRSLIKGSAIAIPAILTLRSGAALAVESASCALKLKSSGVDRDAIPVTTVGSSSDGWARQATSLGTMTLVTKPGDPVATPIPVFLDPTGSNRWYASITNTGNSDYFTAVGGSGKYKSSITGAQYNFTGTGTGFVLIQIDNNGNIVAYGKAAATGDFPYASTSCWTSLGN